MEQRDVITLPNGARIVFDAMPGLRTASVGVYLGAGARHEPADRNGLAHFLEHMAFNGTQNFKPGELVSFLESIGARFGPHVNASTSFDETIYMLDIPTDRPGYVEKGMLVLHDFANGISLAPEEVEKERGVVLEEWRGRLGAGSRLTDKQLPVIFQGSRYAERLPIGLPEILKSAPRERLVAFYEKWYRPDNMAVIVVGDIPVDEAEKLVQQNFGKIPAS
jgi:zinc protease